MRTRPRRDVDERLRRDWLLAHAPRSAFGGASEAGTISGGPPVSLPISAPLSEYGTRPALRPFLHTVHVAIAEDDPLILNVLSRILADTERVELVTATSGELLLERLAPKPVRLDVLITDEVMPGISGQELAVAVRALYPGVKVLYETGYADRLFKTRGELEPGAAFLEKPFTARGLREAVRLLLFDALNPAGSPGS